MPAQKTVSQLDAAGIFVGPTLADESPLEPGVWLLPGGAVDVLPPVVPDGRQMVWNGQGFELVALPDPEPEPAPPTLAERQTEALRQIDADVDAITAAVIGNRGVEYIEAETQALAFQTAGFTGAAPSMVQAWVNAKGIEGIGWTAQQAAEDILAQAAAWRYAVDVIRANRLNAKAYIRIAEDDEDLAVATGTWAGFVQAIRSQLGI
jgi:hypothetical protein